MSQDANPGQLLREHLFEGELIQLPAPEDGLPGFLPDWFEGTLPTLVYPPIRERSLEEGAEVNLEVTPYHIYYGTLRELAESAGGTARFDLLHRLIREWNPNAARELCDLARRQIERALLHYELALELTGEDQAIPGVAETVEYCESALEAAPSFTAGPAPEAEQPTEEQAAFQEAQSVLNEDPRRSVELLLPLSEIHPDAPEVWFVLGAAFRRMEDTAEAERCLRRAARLAPNEPFIWWELATTCAAVGQWKAADEALRKCRELDPNNVLYLCDHARVLLKLGDRDAAQEAVEAAEELVPDDATVVEARALLDGNRA